MIATAESEIAGRLAWTLKEVVIDEEGRRIEREKAADPDATDLAMRGWAVFNRLQSAANVQEAQRYFERALEIDPESVNARSGVAAFLGVAQIGGGAGGR